MEKENIILSDCEEWKIKDFKEGVSEVTNKKFKIISKICIGKRTLINNIYRYITYIFWPFKIFLKRSKYDVIIGWQQFFTIFFSFYCNLFKVKKENKIVIANFTYKPKNGIKGKIYKKLMKFCLNPIYIDYIHVPSANYAKQISKDFNIGEKKFIVAHFGIEDMFEKYKKLKKEQNNDYTLALGRSNRDYDFLISEWKKIPNTYKLIIISDTYKTNKKLPNNITILNNVVGDKQYNYIINSKMMIIPINKENICSGDTVLLTAMSFEKLVVVTKPSTLAEMYIENGVNGIALEKRKDEFAKNILNILKDENKILAIGKNARKIYLDKYSRVAMGERIGEVLNENSNDRA